MKNDMPELKSCPFCGEAPIVGGLKDEWVRCKQHIEGWIKTEVWNTRADLTTPNQCCGAVGKEACTRYDQDGEECDVKRAGVDDGLLAEAVEYVKQSLVSADDLLWVHINNIITHALKTRKEPVEMTVDKLISLHGCYGAVRAHELIKYHNGIKIIDGGA